MCMNVNNVPTFHESGLIEIFIIDKQSTVHHTTSVNHKFGLNNKNNRLNIYQQKRIILIINDRHLKTLCYFVRYLASSQNKKCWATDFFYLYARKRIIKFYATD